MGSIVAFSGPRDLWIPQEEIAFAFRMVLGDELPKRVLLGGATGIDTCVAQYVMDEFEMVPRVYPAWWKYYGRPAGPVRNLEMVQDCDIAVVLREFTRSTPGTTNFYNLAQSAGKLSIFYPSPYKLMDEEERRKHKLPIAKQFKRMKLAELRRHG